MTVRAFVNLNFMTNRLMEETLGYSYRLRDLRGTLSQEEFSKKIGVSLRAYQRYESGERVPHPHVLSKIAELCDTTIDWILTGDLNVEKAIILEWAKKTHYLEDLVEKLEQITVRTLKLKLAAVPKEEQETISKIYKDEKSFLVLLKKLIEENINEAKEVKHFEQISHRSPLYSIFHQIERLFNKGETAKIEALKTLLSAFESDPDDDKAKIDAFKLLVTALESDLKK